MKLQSITGTILSLHGYILNKEHGITPVSDYCIEPFTLQVTGIMVHHVFSPQFLAYFMELLTTMWPFTLKLIKNFK